MQRLTDARWRAAVEALTGVAWEGSLPVDYDLEGFRTIGAGTQTISASELATYELASWSVAVSVFPDAASRAEVVGCELVGGPLARHESADGGVDAACLRGWLVELASQAWRRPVTVSEIEALEGLFVELAAHTEPTLAARATLVAVLLSPDFVYLIEHGAPGEPLSAHELAARLSFFLTDGPPDALLRERADDGRILEDDVLETQALRLLESRDGQAAMAAWFDDLLDLGAIETVEKSSALYPEDSPALREAMAAELLALWEETATGDLTALLTSETALVDAELAALYGIPDVDAPASQPLPEAEPRGGLMGRAGFATLTGTAERGSPTLRGRFIRERLLCEPVSAPPADLDFSAALEGASEGAPFREQLEAITAGPECQACHLQMDPLGLGLENLDGLGRWREFDAGVPVDASGELDGQAFHGPRELGRVVSEDPRFTACMDEHLQAHALGARQDLGETGLTLPELVVRFVLSDAFRSRGVRPGEVCSDEGAQRACATDCGEGVEVCAEGRWTGCTAPWPAQERCSGEDDDCDGTIDELLRIAEGRVEVCSEGVWDVQELESLPETSLCGDAISLSVVSGAALQEAYSYCEPTDTPDEITCALAADQVCVACGAEAGLGPLASDPLEDQHTIACLSGASIMPILRDFEALEETGAGCSSGDPWSAACAVAASQVCEDAGLLTGFGPRLYTEDGIELGCTPGAARLPVAFEALAEHEAGCSSDSALRTGPCTLAIAVHCRSLGFLAGFGPVAVSEDQIEVVCLRGTQ